ncbi:Cadherin domain protein [Stratiformator vulcanicus]|uniref:Cadherin domain protein n=2 Tax=Stratiformator vulcanicus TaxID=2527980 RepID=A0A517R5Z7_9PLAN|nr:Cadherin domain protein [Stratiformator vulcanicus]
MLSGSPGGVLNGTEPVLLDANFSTQIPSATTPIGTVDYVHPSLEYGGVSLGTGAQVPWNADEFEVQFSSLNASGASATNSADTAAKSDRTTLGFALENDQYVAFTVVATNGTLDLRDMTFEFTLQRQSWHAPRQFAVATFTPDGQFLGDPFLVTEAVKGGQTEDIVLHANVPMHQAWSNVSGPIEVRLYAYDSAYRHRLSVKDFRVLGDSTPVIVTDSLPQLTLGKAFETQLESAGGSGQVGWWVSGGAVPPGMALSEFGQLIGTPSEVGAYTFHVTAMDFNGDQATRTLSLEVVGEVPVADALLDVHIEGIVPEITGGTFGDAVVAEGLSFSGIELGEGARRPWNADEFEVQFRSRDAEGNSALYEAPQASNADVTTHQFALQQGHYVGFSLGASAGRVDMRGATVEFTVRRQSWHAPRQLALHTSVDGFADSESALLVTKVSHRGDQDVVTYSVTLPGSAAYENLAGPVEFRLYAFESAYAHRLSIHRFAIEAGAGTPAAEPPSFAAPTYAFSVDENATSGTPVGTVSASDPDGGALRYEIVEQTPFVIDEQSGQLALAGDADYEDVSSYQFSVRAVEVDNPTQTATVEVTIDVNDLNEAPTIGHVNTLLVAEGTAAGFVLGQIEASDPDGDSVTFTLAGTTGPVPFEIDSDGTVRLTGPVDYETVQSYQLHVLATDEHGLASEPTTVSANVTDVNEAPLVNPVGELILTEDTAVGTVVATINAYDPEGQPLTFSLADSSGYFAVDANSGEITVAAPLDFEVSPTEILSISISDGNRTTIVDVDVTVQDTAPVPQAVTLSIDELTDAGTEVGTLVAGGDTTSLTWSIQPGLDADLFLVEPDGRVLLNAVLDHEQSPARSFFASVTDGTSTDTVLVQVTINDVNEAPEFDQDSFAFTVEEITSADGSVVIGTISANDPEGNSLNFSGVGIGSLPFTVDGDGSIRLIAPLDYETTADYTFEVVASDGVLTDTATVVISVSDTPPVLLGAEVLVDEATADGSPVGQLHVLGDATGLSWEILDGNDHALFAIDSTTGIVSLTGTLDFESRQRFDLTIRAASGGGSSTNVLTILVGDVNEAPTFISGDSVQIAEDAAIGTAVWTAEADDPEGLALQYSIVTQSAPNAFLIDAATGVVEVAAGLDFEVLPTHSLTISVSDGEFAVEQDVEIAINDVNELPTFASVMPLTIEENLAAGTVVTTLSAVDPDDDLLTYSLVADESSALFAIDATSGALTLTASPNFEIASTHSVTVEVTDGFGKSQIVLPITITDLDETVPLAAPDRYLLRPGRVLSGNVLSNDLNLPSGAVAVLEAGPASGQLAFGDDGGFTYTPPANPVGTEAFRYRVENSSGATITAGDVTIEFVDDSRLTVSRRLQFESDGSTDFSAAEFIGSDTGVEPATAEVIFESADAAGIVTTAAGSFEIIGSFLFDAVTGTARVAHDAVLQYTPSIGETNGDRVAFRIVDAIGEVAEGAATLTAGPTAPLAIGDSAQSDGSSGIVLDVLANDLRPSGSDLAVVSVGNSAHGQVSYQRRVPISVATAFATLAPSGVTLDEFVLDAFGGWGALADSGFDVGFDVAYTPDSGFIGFDSFQYTVRSDDGLESTAMVTIAIGLHAGGPGGTGGVSADIPLPDGAGNGDGTLGTGDSLLGEGIFDAIDLVGAPNRVSAKTGFAGSGSPGTSSHFCDSESVSGTNVWYDSTGVAYTAVVSLYYQICIDQTFNADGSWTFVEDYSANFTVSTTSDLGGPAELTFGTFDYTFDAFGDQDSTDFTFTTSTRSQSSGSFTVDYGDVPGGQPTVITNDWTEQATHNLTVTYNANHLAGTVGGSRSEFGTRNMTYLINGSYDSGATAGTISGMGTETANSNYLTTYNQNASGQWFFGGGGQLTQTANESSNFSGGGSFGSTSSNDSSYFNLTGSISESGGSHSQSMTVSMATLAADGTWLLSGGMGTASGGSNSDRSTTETGGYGRTLDGGLLTGTINGGSYENTSSNWNTSATVSAGEWVTTGTADESSNSGWSRSYEGSGDYNVTRDDGAMEVTVNGTFDESGSDGWTSNYRSDQQLLASGDWMTVSATADSTDHHNADSSYDEAGTYTRSIGNVTADDDGNVTNSLSVNVEGTFEADGSDGDFSQSSVNSELIGETWVATGGTASDGSHQTRNRNFESNSDTTYDKYIGFLDTTITGDFEENGDASSSFGITGEYDLIAETWVLTGGGGTSTGDTYHYQDFSTEDPVTYTRTPTIGEGATGSGTIDGEVKEESWSFVSETYNVNATVENGEFVYTGSRDEEHSGDNSLTYDSTGGSSDDVVSNTIPNNPDDPAAGSRTISFKYEESGTIESDYNDTPEFELIEGEWELTGGTGTNHSKRDQQWSYELKQGSTASYSRPIIIDSVTRGTITGTVDKEEQSQHTISTVDVNSAAVNGKWVATDATDTRELHAKSKSKQTGTGAMTVGPSGQSYSETTENDSTNDSWDSFTLVNGEWTRDETGRNEVDETWTASRDIDSTFKDEVSVSIPGSSGGVADGTRTVKTEITGETVTGSLNHTWSTDGWSGTGNKTSNGTTEVTINADASGNFNRQETFPNGDTAIWTWNATYNSKDETTDTVTEVKESYAKTAGDEEGTWSLVSGDSTSNNKGDSDWTLTHTGFGNLLSGDPSPVVSMETKEIYKTDYKSDLTSKVAAGDWADSGSGHYTSSNENTLEAIATSQRSIDYNGSAFTGEFKQTIKSGTKSEATTNFDWDDTENDWVDNGTGTVTNTSNKDDGWKFTAEEDGTWESDGKTIDGTVNLTLEDMIKHEFSLTPAGGTTPNGEPTFTGEGTITSTYTETLKYDGTTDETRTAHGKTFDGTFTSDRKDKSEAKTTEEFSWDQAAASGEGEWVTASVTGSASSEGHNNWDFVGSTPYQSTAYGTPINGTANYKVTSVDSYNSTIEEFDVGGEDLTEGFWEWLTGEGDEVLSGTASTTRGGSSEYDATASGPYSRIVAAGLVYEHTVDGEASEKVVDNKSHSKTINYSLGESGDTLAWVVSGGTAIYKGNTENTKSYEESSDYSYQTTPWADRHNHYFYHWTGLADTIDFTVETEKNHSESTLSNYQLNSTLTGGVWDTTGTGSASANQTIFRTTETTAEAKLDRFDGDDPSIDTRGDRQSVKSTANFDSTYNTASDKSVESQYEFGESGWEFVSRTDEGYDSYDSSSTFDEKWTYKDESWDQNDPDHDYSWEWELELTDGESEYGEFYSWDITHDPAETDQWLYDQLTDPVTGDFDDAGEEAYHRNGEYFWDNNGVDGPASGTAGGYVYAKADASQTDKTTEISGGETDENTWDYTTDLGFDLNWSLERGSGGTVDGGWDDDATDDVYIGDMILEEHFFSDYGIGGDVIYVAEYVYHGDYNDYYSSGGYGDGSEGAFAADYSSTSVSWGSQQILPTMSGWASGPGSAPTDVLITEATSTSSTNDYGLERHPDLEGFLTDPTGEFLESDYSNPFYEWAGESIRSLVGDEAIIDQNNSDLFILASAAHQVNRYNPVYYVASEFIIEPLVDEFNTHWENTEGESLGNRIYTSLGGTVGNFIGLGGLVDAYEGKDAEGNRLGGWERAGRGVMGAVDLVSTAVPIGKGVGMMGKTLSRMGRTSGVFCRVQKGTNSIAGKMRKGWQPFKNPSCFTEGHWIVVASPALADDEVIVTLPEIPSADDEKLASLAIGTVIAAAGLVILNRPKRRRDDELKPSGWKSMTRGWDISATAKPGVTDGEFEFCDDEPLRFIAKPRPEPIIKIDDAPTTPARSASKGRDQASPASLWRVALALTLLLTGGLIATATFFTSGGATAAVAQNAAPTSEIDTSYRKRIEEIQAGDKVLARDEHGAAIGWREVEEVFERTTDHLRHLKIRSDAGEVQDFETTDEHPFWSETRKAWVDAGDLEPGEKLTGPNGEQFTLVLTQRAEHPEGVTVYNFRVADAHTYYVAANNNPRGPPVLVHNAEYVPGGGRPNQIHHFATNKNNKYTPAMEEIADSYGLKLDDAWNKSSLPHLGRHPNKYHDFVLEGMRRAQKEAGSNTDLFLELYNLYVKEPVRLNPDLLRSIGWK